MQDYLILGTQLGKLKSATKNETGVTLILSSNMIGNSNEETNFSHKLVLTDRQVSIFVRLLQIVCQLI